MINNYNEIKKRIIFGWNTWNTRSVMSHVLMPCAFSVNLCIKDYATGDYLKESLVGRPEGTGCGQRSDNSAECVSLGGHSYNGDYTELNLEWRQTKITVKSGVIDGDLVILVQPEKTPIKSSVLVVESGFLWGRQGKLYYGDDKSLTGETEDTVIKVYTSGETINEPGVPCQTPYFAVELKEAIGISTGKKRTVAEIEAAIEKQQNAYLASLKKYGKDYELYYAMQCSLAWDTIYDPIKNRVITPISRMWSCEWGGYVLYCWDTYFTAYMLSVDNKELAYCNAIEITHELTDAGFVPNCSAGNGFKTLDRSQPPVGSMTLLHLYHRYKEQWILQMLFDDLLAWNRWYAEHREINTGTLALGSNPYPPVIGNYWEQAGLGDIYGAAMESGLDNSAMYDEARFDKKRGLMLLEDVGQTSLYLADCCALMEIAAILGREEAVKELETRRERFAKGLSGLWSEKDAMYLNRESDTGKFSVNKSPTNFYPLLTGLIPYEHAVKMVEEHLCNPEEFWGTWVIPSTPRNEPAYAEQNYWRGRIWAPLNFLIYLGLAKYDMQTVMHELAEKSRKLFLKEWREKRHIHENYNADTGEGCDVANSEKFYHWGALLSLIALMDSGF